jgi:hypothetical protein
MPIRHWLWVRWMRFREIFVDWVDEAENDKYGKKDFEK